MQWRMCDMNLRVVLRSGIGDPQYSEAVDDIEQRDKDLDILSVTEKRERHRWSKTTPWQSISKKSPPSESADQDVVTYRSGAGPATTPWQRTAQQCWCEHQQPRRCKLPQYGGGEAEQTRIGAQS